MDISTELFLSTIFEQVPENEMILVALHTDDRNPHQVGYFGEELTPGAWYFNVSTVVRQMGISKRTKAHCKAIYCVVMDDIGGKYPVPPVAPSWILESSEGNYQYGYLLIMPAVTEEEMALVEDYWAGFGGIFSDKISTRTRVMRVPGSLHRTGFVARIVEWNMDRHFDIVQLAADCNILPRSQKATFTDSCGLDPLIAWMITNQAGRENQGLIEIDCPWASEHTTGDRGAAFFPVGYQGRQSRGFKCMHSHCADRNIQDLLQEVARRSGEVFTSTGSVAITNPFLVLMATTPQVHAADLPDVKVTMEGVVKAVQLASESNVRWVMDQLGIVPRVNMMTKEHELHADWSTDYMEIFAVLDNKLQLANIDARGKILKMVGNLGEGYHPIIEQLSPWDGVDRWCQLAATVTVAEDAQDAWRNLLRRWILQCVKAWASWEHPVQAGGVMVFVGAQGIGKTRWIKRLHPATLTGRHIDMKVKDSIMECLAHPIVELGELDATFRKADISALKAFLTTEEDKWRAPYAERAEMWPRCTVFAASVNQADFLQDTENRRFWPVPVESLNPEHDIDMMQVYSQAMAELEAGDIWWLEGEELSSQVIAAEEHRSISETEDAFDSYFNEARLGLDKVEWTHGNALDMQKCMALPVTQPRARSELVCLLSKHFGAKVMRLGLRGWWVPVSKAERVGAGCPVKGAPKPPLKAC